MGTGTKIEWTDATWNPIRGCSRISEGCRNCYAERMAARQLPEMRFSDGSPLAIMTPSGPQWTGRLELIPHMLEIPLRRHKPTRWFVNSMSDLFHESLPFEDSDRVFTAMVAADWHTYQILTKRSARMREYFASGRHDHGAGPDRAGYHLGQDIWLGVSVEDREHLSRVDDLRATPAAVRFLSIEPLLEDLGKIDLTGIDLVIIGGESGPGARPCNLAWIRSLIAQCRAAGVACFVKQLGAVPVESEEEWRGRAVGRLLNTRHRNRAPEGTVPLKLKDSKGGEPEEWPAELRVRQLPKVRR